MPFRTLNSRHIAETLERLAARIKERFPEASLNNVVAELIELANRDELRTQRLARPYFALRAGTLTAIIAAIGALIYMGYRLLNTMEMENGRLEIFSVFAGVEAGLNIVILAAVAIFTLSRIEERLKRSLALDDLHELRSVAHVVDMHQLTKDPTALLRLGPRTVSSPDREMTEFELSRYLDYCAEMLSLAGKIAALYAQNSRDPVVIASVNDIETLTSNMASKIWQKIMIIRSGRTGELEGEAEPI